MKLSLIFLTLLFAGTNTVQAQSNSDYQDFGLGGILQHPQRPVPFLNLTYILVYSYATKYYSEPIDINSLNITFDAMDEVNEPRQPLSADY